MRRTELWCETIGWKLSLWNIKTPHAHTMCRFASLSICFLNFGLSFKKHEHLSQAINSYINWIVLEKSSSIVEFW